MSGLPVAVRYAVFAAAAAPANLSVRRVSLWLYRAERSLMELIRAARVHEVEPVSVKL